MRSPERTPRESACWAESAALVRSALETLPPPQREAIHLRYYECLDCGQVAQRLGRSRAAVHSLLFHARQRMRQLLSKLRDEAD